MKNLFQKLWKFIFKSILIVIGISIVIAVIMFAITALAVPVIWLEEIIKNSDMEGLAVLAFFAFTSITGCLIIYYFIKKLRRKY